jgi:hypothetical protein
MITYFNFTRVDNGFIIDEVGSDHKVVATHVVSGCTAELLTFITMKFYGQVASVPKGGRGSFYFIPVTSIKVEPDTNETERDLPF